MGLIRRNPAAKFEGDPAANTAAAAPSPAPAPAPAPGPAPVPAPAPTGTPIGDAPTATVQRLPMVRAAAGSLAPVMAKMAPALIELKDAFKVEFDTFPRLKSGSGNIVDGDNNSLGAQIAMTILSWQETWDVSPGSDALTAKAAVRYSDDGVLLNDGSGISVADYLNELREAGYTQCALKPKTVIVGILEAAEKPTNLLGQTVQVSLSTQSKKTFDRHRFNVGVNVQLSKRASAAGAERILVTAEAKSSNSKNYTLLIVSEDTEANAAADTGAAA